ncbi:ribulose-phosphate 3-epimerase [Aerococcaceae bacterium DSM 109653]|uniref:Ribulose-phosphate 3-epimerase n=1 Tax=Fundicoccus ignavus TaxID=2664442 RepID=A0A844BL37_9LACT|nr:ribulose-phosphate 3-epimerase [Fundicoccus ignavus]MRI82620.1 ribulose-phosphate 3-epimerase [Fundicoccus ignavus]
MKQLVASIMCGDQLNLKAELEGLLEAGINWLHCDVMDGVFVNNLAMGPYDIEAIQQVDGFTLDVHLATVTPDKYIEMYGPLKPDYITFHIETSENPQKSIDLIKSFECKVGLAFSPETPVSEVEPYLDQIDLLLVMTVNPGFAGQQFNESVLNKLKELTDIFVTMEGPRPLVEVDGNIYSETIEKMSAYEVDLYVLGTSALFREDGLSYTEKAERLNEVINL